VPTALDTLTSGLASIVRVGENGLAGVDVAPNVKAQGDIGLTLFDVENSKDCRLVRELVTELDLVVDIVPVGKGSKNQAPKEAPCLVAMSNGGEETVVSGVTSIKQFLKKTFSEEASEVSTDAGTLQQVVEAITPVSLAAAGLLRTGRGDSIAPTACASNKVNRPEKKIMLYSYEGNQFCRLVREVLTELDISYELRSAGKKSPRREELAGITGGSTQCPYFGAY
jgi:anaphase-promoting complex subunit 7